MSTRLTLCALLGGALVLAGCGGSSPPPAADPPATPTMPTASPSPTEDASAEPTERESPEEFIRRWVEASTEMQNTGDATEYRNLSRECAPCEEFASRVEGYYADGGYVETKGWSINTVDQVGRSGRLRGFRVEVAASPTEFKESHDSEVEELEGGDAAFLVEISRKEDSWRVENLSQYSE